MTTVSLSMHIFVKIFPGTAKCLPGGQITLGWEPLLYAKTNLSTCLSDKNLLPPRSMCAFFIYLRPKPVHWFCLLSIEFYTSLRYLKSHLWKCVALQTPWDLFSPSSEALGMTSTSSLAEAQFYSSILVILITNRWHFHTGARASWLPNA